MIKYERPWGYFITSSEIQGNNYKVKKLLIKPGQRLSLQKHHFRDEIWTIVQGECEIQIDSNVFNGKKSDYFYISKEVSHRVSNSGDIDLIIVEVQIGDDLREDDIIRLEDDYGRK